MFTDCTITGSVIRLWNKVPFDAERLKSLPSTILCIQRWRWFDVFLINNTSAALIDMPVLAIIIPLSCGMTERKASAFYGPHDIVSHKCTAAICLRNIARRCAINFEIYWQWDKWNPCWRFIISQLWRTIPFSFQMTVILIENSSAHAIMTEVGRFKLWSAQDTATNGNNVCIWWAVPEHVVQKVINGIQIKKYFMTFIIECLRIS